MALQWRGSSEWGNPRYDAHAEQGYVSILQEIKIMGGRAKLKMLHTDYIVAKQLFGKDVKINIPVTEKWNSKHIASGCEISVTDTNTGVRIYSENVRDTESQWVIK